MSHRCCTALPAASARSSSPAAALGSSSLVAWPVAQLRMLTTVLRMPLHNLHVASHLTLTGPTELYQWRTEVELQQFGDWKALKHTLEGNTEL